MSSDSYYLGYDDGYKEGYADAIKELKPHWIPCSERPPEEDDVEVLCTVKQQNKTNRSETIIVEQGCYFYGTWLLSYDNQRVNCSREVLAWQPLPSPYRGEGEQNEINRC